MLTTTGSTGGTSSGCSGSTSGATGGGVFVFLALTAFLVGLALEPEAKGTTLKKIDKHLIKGFLEENTYLDNGPRRDTLLFLGLEFAQGTLCTSFGWQLRRKDERLVVEKCVSRRKRLPKLWTCYRNLYQHRWCPWFQYEIARRPTNEMGVGSQREKPNRHQRVWCRS